LLAASDAPARAEGNRLRPKEHISGTRVVESRFGAARPEGHDGTPRLFQNDLAVADHAGLSAPSRWPRPGRLIRNRSLDHPAGLGSDPDRVYPVARAGFPDDAEHVVPDRPF
jgi:hypothetical protein